jgi:hypothetical protein
MHADVSFVRSVVCLCSVTHLQREVLCYLELLQLHQEKYAQLSTGDVHELMPVLATALPPELIQEERLKEGEVVQLYGFSPTAMLHFQMWSVCKHAETMSTSDKQWRRFLDLLDWTKSNRSLPRELMKVWRGTTEAVEQYHARFLYLADTFMSVGNPWHRRSDTWAEAVNPPLNESPTCAQPSPYRRLVSGLSTSVTGLRSATLPTSTQKEEGRTWSHSIEQRMLKIKQQQEQALIQFKQFCEKLETQNMGYPPGEAPFPAWFPALADQPWWSAAEPFYVPFMLDRNSPFWVSYRLYVRTSLLSHSATKEAVREAEARYTLESVAPPRVDVLLPEKNPIISKMAAHVTNTITSMKTTQTARNMLLAGTPGTGKTFAVRQYVFTQHMRVGQAMGTLDSGIHMCLRVCMTHMCVCVCV